VSSTAYEIISTVAKIISATDKVLSATATLISAAAKVNFTKISENPKDFNAGVYLRWPPGGTKNNEIPLYFPFIAHASDLCGLRGRTNCFGK